jgi:predicted GNAT family N-acyltransferase
VSFRIDIVRWDEAEEALAAIRRRVFIEEQHVPESLEWDGLDADAIHLLACTDDGSAIGCARILPDGWIGRMSVLPEYRGQGAGTELLRTAVQQLRLRGDKCAQLSAQEHAIPFYAAHGFSICSAPYFDAGITHRDMLLALSA